MFKTSFQHLINGDLKIPFCHKRKYDILKHTMLILFLQKTEVIKTSLTIYGTWMRSLNDEAYL